MILTALSSFVYNGIVITIQRRDLLCTFSMQRMDIHVEKRRNTSPKTS